jgi:hypothetical protein
VTINLKENYLIVTDNGVGLNEKDFKTFLQPNVTFKDKGYRGHKGVGATYLAYSFNYVQICSKTSDYTVITRMYNAKKWVKDSDLDQLSKFPTITLDSSPKDTNFNDIDKGFSICIQCDKETVPRDLSWRQIKDAETWLYILRIKTGLGAIKKQDNIRVNIEVIDKDGNKDHYKQEGIEYLWIHDLPLDIRTAKLSEIQKKKDSLYKKHQDVNNLRLYTSQFKNLDIIYDFYDVESLIQLIEDLDFKDDENNELKNLLLDVCRQYTPIIYCSYSYSENFWDQLNNGLKIGRTAKYFKSGIQLAADNMPQGEIRPIDLKSTHADRTYLVIHFDNCEVDIGRKSFPKEIEDFAQEISKIIIDYFCKYRQFLKEITGQKINRQRKERVAQWKEKLKKYTEKNPLNISKYNMPMVCKPGREQEVVALFNQLLGAKIIRGFEIMSTDQNFIYDCLYRHKVEPSQEYIYSNDNNPLGLFKEDIINNYESFGFPFSSSPQVLEYKFSIDGLIENLKGREKNSNEIDLLVVWETGDKWRKNYHITSCLDRDNICYRPYHGITHIMYNRLGEEEMYLIVLEELINFLNNPDEEEERQKGKYEE